MTRVFISYARSEDDGFVERLYRKLGEASFTVWWDEFSMRSRSLPFLYEVREGLKDADRVLVVVGPGALASRYVQQEWQYALSLSKPVIPLLRKGGVDLLPPELRMLHARDFLRNDFEDELPKLIDDLRAPPPPLGELHGDVPEQPRHYRPRPLVLSRLAGLVTRDLQQPKPLAPKERLTVLHGMGGLGKTVMAAAYSRMTGVRRVFNDGIFWHDTRTKPDLTELAELVWNTLPPKDRGQRTAVDPVTSLKGPLQHRSCLLVLDNVADPSVIRRARDLLGPDGRLLVTCRERLPVTELGGLELSLELLPEAEAAELLADWSGQESTTWPPAAQEVLARCGRHPFAVALCGALVRQGHSWERVARDMAGPDLVKLDARLDDYTYHNLAHCLDVSVKALAPCDAARLRDLVVFHPANPTSEVAVHRFWAGAERESADATADLISQLAERALITTIGQAPARGIVLHDLMRAYLAPNPEDSQSQHRRLLAAYGKDETEWLQAPHDGYFLSHLGYHLIEAGKAENLHSLLALESAAGRNAWHAKLASHKLERQFIPDVRLAQGLAPPAVQAPHATADAATSLARAARYALYLSSLTSHSARLPTQLLVTLLREGSITFEEALSQAMRVPTASQRAERLAALAKSSIDSQGEILESLEELDEESRAAALGTLVRVLGDGHLHDALRMARAISDPDRRVPLLTAFVPRLGNEDAPGLAVEVEQATEAVEDSSIRAIVLLDLALAASDARKLDLLRKALGAAKSVPRSFPRSVALGRVAPQVAQAGLVDEALTALERDGSVMAWNLIEDPLIPCLPVDRQLQLWEAVRHEQTDEHVRLASLVAAQLPEPTRTGAFRWAIEGARRLKNHSANGPLARLIETLPAERLDQILDVVTNGPDFLKAKLCGRLAALGRLAPARDLIRSIGDPVIRIQAAGGLLPHVPDRERLASLRAACLEVETLGNADHWRQAIDALSPWFSKALAEQAREGAVQRGDDQDIRLWLEAAFSAAPDTPGDVQAQRRWIRAAAGLDPIIACLVWASLGDRLPEDLQQELARSFHRLAAAALPCQWNFLTPLVALLPDEALESTLRELEKTSGEALEAALIALAPRLSPQLLDQAMVRARTARACGAVEALIDRLAEHDPARALEEIAGLDSPDQGLAALARVVPRLPPPLLQRALTLTRAATESVDLGDELGSTLAHTLEAFSRNGLAAQAAALAAAIKLPAARIQALAHVAPQLPSRESQPIWQGIPGTLEEVDDVALRLSALLDAARLAPEPHRAAILAQAVKAAIPLNLALARREPESTPGMLRRAVVPLARLAQALPEPQRMILSELALDILAEPRYHGTRWERGCALDALASLLPEELLPRACGLALGIEEVLERMNERAVAVHGLSHRFLGLGQLRAAFDLVRHVRAPIDRALSLADLASRALSTNVRSEELVCSCVEHLRAQSSATRRDVLADLVGFASLIIRCGGQEAAQSVRQSVGESARWWP